MEQESVVIKNHIGGLGCKFCRFWLRHDVIKASLVKLDTSWGRCMNTIVNDICDNDREKFINSSYARTNVDIEKLSDDIIYVSTFENFSCPYFRGEVNTE